MSRFFSFIFLLMLAVTTSAVPAFQSPALVPNTTLEGKVMCGYQGWFNAQGDGANRGWRHWNGTLPGPGNTSVDLWPDTSELAPNERFDTGFKLKDGRVAQVFSSFKRQTVLRHFRWMRDYGIDGVWMQRFATEVSNPSGRAHFDAVLDSARTGARKSGRVYGVMYDLSGIKTGGIEAVISDWKTLFDRTRLTRDERYVQHKGRPVVAVWGLGFPDGRDPLFEDGAKLLNFLQHDPIYGGNLVMIGVPYEWRTLDSPTVPHAKMELLALQADIISPWAVGTKNNLADIARQSDEFLVPDLEWCRAHGKDYLPVVYPGFSWFNLRHGQAPSNQIPRLRGQFLWAQFLEAKARGASMIYVAMFDEVDEGTAIFKITEDVPDGEGKSQFVGLEGVPNDFYLNMTGWGAKLLRGEIQADDERPLQVR